MKTNIDWKDYRHYQQYAFPGQNYEKYIDVRDHMTDEEMENLFLKDAYNRLEYNTKCYSLRLRPDGEIVRSGRKKLSLKVLNTFKEDIFEYLSLYLFPLSSMTDEQKTELDTIKAKGIDAFEELDEFYHKNHLDFRGLIELGIAIDATNKNIY